MTERTGEAFEAGEQLTVIGDRLAVGDAAPPFTLDLLDASDGAIRPVSLADSAGTTRLLNVINSIDTSVCQVETRSWERSLPVGDGSVRVYTVSMDLPFALDRWRQAEDASHALLSAHRDEGFGRAYGVLIKEWRLLQRAVFVIGPDDRLSHVEYVADQMKEPDYSAALAALPTLG
ncbi:thiol peroxidase [Streptacidiphilus sp. MAP12-20]|uniref:thiol peroxidase n=1 Tax=Streptacidiphilus sp. MAP12-20 TaxID=3156299 RepID=UPI0035199973